MHWVVPFASDLSEACRQVLQDLRLPNLERLLARCTLSQRDDGEASSFSPPHERALAHARGWQGGDGMLPFAADAAAADGIDVGSAAWALLTPSHWQLGRDHVTLLDPDALGLDETESHALFDSLREWLDADGFNTAWGAPTRWYAARDDLDGLATASLDRAIHRDVEPWLRASAPGGEAAPAFIKTMRRLQSEAQLLFHSHPVNEAREARGVLPVNSFWLSGCGRAQGVRSSDPPRVAADLRSTYLQGDWAAWAEAWQRLDADALAPLLQQAQSGQPAALSLCGVRSWARYDAAPQSLWQRARGAWTKPSAAAVLLAL